MAFPFFKARSKSHAELVRQFRDGLLAVAAKGPEGKDEKTPEEVGRVTQAIKQLLHGQGEQEPNADVAASLTLDLCNQDVPVCLLQSLPNLDFEVRKDATSIWSAMLRQSGSGRAAAVQYIENNPEILNVLIKGCKDLDIALNCGVMLRESCRHANLARLALASPNFDVIFETIESVHFEVASDAFQTFKDLLTKHKSLVSDFLQEHYIAFFEKYNHLLESKNYVTRRQSVKLLGELLLDRANASVMLRYISDPQKLRLMMILLRDSSRSIQYEAFHVFKVFVANPNKPPQIVKLLSRNKAKLLSFLRDFQPDKEDEQFDEEKEVIVSEIGQLPEVL